MVKLYLDDVRVPRDSAGYMYRELGARNLIYMASDWQIVRSYEEFVTWISMNGLPALISFDHDLADEHYTDCNPIDYTCFKEKTGFSCAKWLVEFCIKGELVPPGVHAEYPLPEFIVHSMNLVGKQNIEGLLNNFKKYQHGKG